MQVRRLARVELNGKPPSSAGSVDQDCRIISPHTLPKKGSGKKLEFVKCLSSLDPIRALDGFADKGRHVPGPLCRVSATPRLMVHILADPSSAVVKSSISGFLAIVEDETPMAAVGSRKTIDVTAEAPWARAKWVLRTYLQARSALAQGKSERRHNTYVPKRHSQILMLRT